MCEPHALWNDLTYHMQYVRSTKSPFPFISLGYVFLSLALFTPISYMDQKTTNVHATACHRGRSENRTRWDSGISNSPIGTLKTREKKMATVYLEVTITKHSPGNETAASHTGEAVYKVCLGLNIFISLSLSLLYLPLNNSTTDSHVSTFWPFRWHNVTYGLFVFAWSVEHF